MASATNKDKKLFVWKESHEKLFLQEVLALEPYKNKAGSKERGAVWNQIAERLVNAGLKANQRSVRDTFQRLMRDFDNKETLEKRASGIDAEYDEKHQCLFEIKQRIEEIEITREEEDKKKEKEKATAEETRKRATESLSQTKKRKNSSNVDSDEEKEEGSPAGKRKARSSSSYMDVMKESIELKKKEQESMMEIRRKEMEVRAAEVHQQQLLQQQQQQFLQQQQQLFQQQQQQQQTMNFAMINTLKELVQSLKK